MTLSKDPMKAKEQKKKMSDSKKAYWEKTNAEIEAEEAAKKTPIKEEPDVWEDDLFMDKVKKTVVKDLPPPVITKEPPPPTLPPEPPQTKAVVPIDPRKYVAVPTKDSGSHIDADRLHEDTLRYFVEETELGVLAKEQMGIIALLAAGQRLGMQLPASSLFFEVIRQLSSGEEGRGRVQVKEVITAGAFPMSLLFGEQKTGLLESIKGLFGRKDPQPQVQR